MPQAKQFESARFNMVEGQLRPNGVTDPMLTKAFLGIPRERFLPSSMAGLAYVDEDIPLDETRFMMEPMILGRMIQAAEIGKSDVVLDVGCASGYSTALMARFAQMVVGIDPNEELVKAANDQLAALDVDNAAIICGAMEAGCSDQGPFDVILLNGAVASLPKTILQQMADRGRLLTVLRPAGKQGCAVRVMRVGDSWSTTPLFDANTPYLEGFQPQPGFVF